MADINTGSTGQGRSASEPLIAGHLASRAAGTGPSGGVFGENSRELESFIRTAAQGKSAVSDLLGLLSGDGKTKVSNFTGAIKSLNTELRRSVDLLNQAKAGAGNLPAGLGGAGAGGNGGDVKLPTPAAPAAEGGGSGGNEGGSSPTPRENGGSGALKSLAGNIAMGLAAGGILAATAGFQRQTEPAAFFDTLVRQRSMYQGGRPQSWADQYTQFFRGAGASIGGIENYAAMDASMRGGGVLRGTQGYTNIMRGTAAAAFAMPGADRGQLAGTATSLQHGGVAMGLRQRGITSFSDDFPTQMRKIMRAAMGGKQPTEELMALIRPGTIYYDNLMALVGDDPAMVAQIIEFNRADAKGRSVGADVTTRAGATRVGLGDRSIEGAQSFAAAEKMAATTTDRLEQLNQSFRAMADRSESVNEWLQRLPQPISDLIVSLGEWSSQLKVMAGTTGMGGVIGPAAFGYFAGGGTIGRVLGGAKSATGATARGAGNLVTGAAQTGGGWLRGAGRFLGRAGVALGLNTAAGAANQSIQPGVDYERDVEMYGRGAADAIQQIVESMPAGSGHDWDAETRARRRAISDIIQDQGVEPRGGLEVRGADHDGEGTSRRGFGGVKPHVAAAGNYLAKKFGPFPGGIGGVGKRSNKSDHPAGLALDFMTNNNTALGDRLVNYLQKNAKHFGVKYIIWKQRINQGSGWKKMADRGSPTANHMDHPHVSFYPDSSQGKEFSGETVGGDGASMEETARQQVARLSGGIGGRSELEIFNSFFGGGARAGTGTAAPGSETGSGEGTRDFGSFRGGQGQLSDTELMQVLQEAGFSGQGLITAFAVARAESGGNSRAFNGNANTGDKSYGLFQINMLGNMGADRRNAYGLSSNEDLYDPVTNARIAFAMSKGGSKWSDWSVHPSSKGRGAKGSGYEQYLDDARAAFTGAGTEPRGGLETGGEGVGYVTPAPAPRSALGRSGGVRDVNVTFKIERATYEEAEKFAGWVMDIVGRRDDLTTIGER